jgi:short-subunit dehydrogenase
MNIQHKLFVITGAGAGMGRTVSLLLLKKGAKVVGLDMNQSALEETKSLSQSEDFSFYVGDITDQSWVQSLPDKIKKEIGPIDGLINNAGIIQPFVKVLDLTEEQIHRVMNVNFFGLLSMTRAFLPSLLKRPEASLVNISSMGGFLPVPGQAIYGASKAAVKLLTEALQSELMNTKVHVTVVFPGGIGTNITKNSGVAMPTMRSTKKSNYKTTTPEKAAEVIVRGIEKNQKRILIGGDAKFMDFLTRLNPAWAAKMIAKALNLS